MLITNADLLNSCRVCRSPNQDGEYECLYTNFQTADDRPELSETGILFENLLDIPLNMWNYYPQFLCNSCDLQIRLFKKLKDKAYKTLEYLQSLHENEYEIDEDIIEKENIEALEEFNASELHSKSKNESKTIYSELEEEQTIGESLLNETEENPNYKNYLTIGEDQLYTKENVHYDRENHMEISVITGDEQLVTNSTHLEGKQIEEEETEIQNFLQLGDEESTNNQLKEMQFLELTQCVESTEDKMSEITLELDANSVIDKNDYVTEIYVTNNEAFNVNDEVLENYDISEESQSENSSVFTDVEYVLEESTDILQEHEMEFQDLELNDFNKAKKRKINNRRSTTKEYKCGPCQLIFKNTQEYKNHRIKAHNDKYPCSVCSKELKSLPALHTHMKLHSDKPAYKCEICEKSFNQKYHFQYHMNRHNNVRNFKCLKCGKAFLSNSDLKIHMRSHTGQRPYVCNICGKDYLMMEHLKAHAFIHTQEQFQCDICLHKFATHKTLRTHIKTIHEDEPRFKCSYCAKAFRRKHHLEYHLRLHQKKVKFLDNNEFIDPDNPNDYVHVIDYNTDDIIDQELVDDPGFIAL